MKPNSVEIELESVETPSDHTYIVSTTITAYLTDDAGRDKNTIIFDCDPTGENYRRTYLQVEFEDRSIAADIRDFLSYHFSNYKDTSRSVTIPVKSGHFSLHPYDSEVTETEDFDEIRIHASGTRIEFGGITTMSPYIYLYEMSENGEPLDENNATKILNFFEEITAEQPIPSTEPVTEDNDVHRLFNQYSVTAQLNAFADPEDQIIQDYEKAIREFKGQEYRDAVRDVGLAGETLIEHLCLELYGKTGTPNRMRPRLNKLDKTEEGLPSYIGKAVSPAWWLRNKANHPSEYDITKADAHFALLCVQAAVEKYVEELLEAEVTY